MLKTQVIRRVFSLGISYLNETFIWNRDLFQRWAEYHRYNEKRRRSGLGKMPEPQEVLNAPYCFVLSTGRCGTGLITKILKYGPDLLVEHNPKPELEYVSSVVHREQPPIESLWIAVLAARFDLFFLEAFRRGRIYVETNNRISFFAPALAEMLPNAKFIHLVRHPADFVRSGMRRNYYKEGSIQHQRLQLLDNDKWNKMSRVEKISWEWNEINSAIEDFKNKCDQSRIMMIKSEDLFTQPELIGAIFTFINQPNPFQSWPIERVRNKLINKPMNKQITGYFPKYSGWTAEDKLKLQSYATLSGRYGYTL
jgi:hypothetical protein